MDSVDHISYHRQSGAWLRDHGGEGRLFSFHIPESAEEPEEIGRFLPKKVKLTDPRKVGVFYLFILGPHLSDAWKSQTDGTKYVSFNLNTGVKTKAAQNVLVYLQQKRPSAPSRNAPASKNFLFPTMDIDVKVSGKALPKQNFAYPAFFRLEVPTIGKPSLHLLWGRYNPQQEDIFDKTRRNKGATDIEPYTWLTKEGMKDKYAIQMASRFRMTKDPVTGDRRLSNSGIASFLTIDPEDQMEEYKRLSNVYYDILNQVGQKVAGKKLFTKTQFRYISEQLE